MSNTRDDISITNDDTIKNNNVEPNISRNFNVIKCNPPNMETTASYKKRLFGYFPKGVDKNISGVNANTSFSSYFKYHTLFPIVHTSPNFNKIIINRQDQTTAMTFHKKLNGFFNQLNNRDFIEYIYDDNFKEYLGNRDFNEYLANHEQKNIQIDQGKFVKTRERFKAMLNDVKYNPATPIKAPPQLLEYAIQSASDGIEYGIKTRNSQKR